MSFPTQTQPDIQFVATGLELLDSGIALLTLDDPDSSANVMNARLQQELAARADQLLNATALVRGLLVATAKPRIFIAGADIKAIASTAHYTHDQVLAFCAVGQKLYQRYATMPFPTIALIQGACVGGGLEFALAMDKRIAVDDPSTLLGLPEVHLGLIPGWAATARVPRLCSVETGMRRIGSGENFSANVALDIGLIDALTSQDQLLEQGVSSILKPKGDWYTARRQEMLGPAHRLLESQIISQIHQKVGDTDDRRTVASATPLDPSELDQLATKIIAQNRENSPTLNPIAPQVVVDLIRRSASVSLQEAADMEAVAMATVYTSPTAQAMVNSFLLNDRAKKSPGLCPRPADLKPIKTLGIVGLGVMGESLAQLLSSSPWNLILFDQDPAKRSLMAQTFGQANLTVAQSIEELANCDVILENVFEQLAVKQQVLQQLESVVGPETILLTNTSVIPIEKMTAALQYPERFGGLHFFNPIRETKLAEIATHPSMSAQAQWTGHLIAKQIRKLTIVVGDGPGLVVNRLLMALLNQAQHLLAEGFTVGQIDAAAVEFGWRLGPFQILDVIGLSTAFDAGRQISSALPGSVDAPPFLVPLIKAGRQGLKNGLGFYRYDADGTRINDPQTANLIGVYIKDTNQSPTLNSSQIGLRLAAAMVWQACEILERRQVHTASDIDLCTILALGFPVDKGGLLFWADQQSPAHLLQQTQTVGKNSGTSNPMNLPQCALDYLYSNKKFYG